MRAPIMGGPFYEVADPRPTTHSSPVVTMNNLHIVSLLLQLLAEALGDDHAAVTAAGATDGDRQIALHLFLVLRNEIRHEVAQPRVERFVLRLLAQVFDDLGIESR